MEIVKDYEFSASRGRGKYAALLEEFLALPLGTTVRLVQGTDFEGDPKKFSMSLRTTLWTKGYKARINVRPDGVYAALVGPLERVAAGEAAARKEDAAAAARAVETVRKRSAARQPQKRAVPSERSSGKGRRSDASGTAAVSGDPFASPFMAPPYQGAPR